MFDIAAERRKNVIFQLAAKRWGPDDAAELLDNPQKAMEPKDLSTLGKTTSCIPFVQARMSFEGYKRVKKVLGL